MAGRIDQINAIWPCCVCLLSGVAEFIQERGNFYSQPAHASAGDEGSLLFTFGTGKYDLVLDIAPHLPHITGMRFRNVDNQKRDLISVLPVELVEGGNLSPEGRSGVTSEDENHWPPLRSKSRDPYLRTFVEHQDGDVGVGVGVFPEREEILLCSFCFSRVACHRVGATELEVGRCTRHTVQHDASVIHQPLELGSCGSTVVR